MPGFWSSECGAGNVYGDIEEAVTMKSLTSGSMSRARAKEPVLLLALLIGGTVFTALRNLEPLLNPTLYAEDGTWAGLGLTFGWLSTAFEARYDYPTVLHVTFLAASAGLSWIWSGSQIAALPQMIAVIGYLIWSLTAVLVYMHVKASSGWSWGLVAFLFVIFLPLGNSNNEVLGRITQIGFLVPLWTYLSISARLKTKGLKKFAYDLILVVLALTSPVAGPVTLACLFVYALYSKTKPRIFFANFQILLSINFLLMLQAVAKKPYPTAIPGDLVLENFIVTFIGRSLLYPFVAPLYGGMNDLLALSLFLALVVIVVWSITSSWGALFADTNLPLIATLLVSLGVTVVARPGLSAFTSSYEQTYPDRYFMGINLLFVLLVILSLGQVRTHLGKFVNTLALVSVTTIVLLNAALFTDFDNPRAPIANSVNHLSRLCSAEHIDENRSQVQIEPANWLMTVPTKALEGLDC